MPYFIQPILFINPENLSPIGAKIVLSILAVQIFICAAAIVWICFED